MGARKARMPFVTASERVKMTIFTISAPMSENNQPHTFIEINRKTYYPTGLITNWTHGPGGTLNR
jgi:hypothetical protein